MREEKISKWKKLGGWVYFWSFFKNLSYLPIIFSWPPLSTPLKNFVCTPSKISKSSLHPAEKSHVFQARRLSPTTPIISPVPLSGSHFRVWLDDVTSWIPQRAWPQCIVVCEAVHSHGRPILDPFSLSTRIWLWRWKDQVEKVNSMACNILFFILIGLQRMWTY